MDLQVHTYSVLIVTDSEAFTYKIMPLLSVTDYYPVTTVRSVSEARRKTVERAYDIIIINAPLPDEFGMHFAVERCQNSGSSVLLMVKSEVFEDIYAKVVGYGVITLSKPTSMQMVAQNLRILCATRERMRQMEAKQATVEEKMQELRLINRAKWLLIECLNMKEPEAHRYIEKLSMDLRVSKKEVAEDIIKTYK